jgi:uncharacterized membrane protein
MSVEEKPRAPLPRSPFGRLRSWFFAGLVLFGPVAVTLYLAWWFVDSVDHWVRPLVPDSFWPDTYSPIHVPGFGLAIVLVGLTLLGFIAANVAGRTLVGLGEAMLDRTPVVRGVYKSVKQIFETLFSQSGTQFRRVGLVEFPMKGAWSIVFLSSEPPPQVASALPGGPMTSVFLPCTPNPTTGFYFYVPTAEIIELTITPDEAVKLVMSAGLIVPEGSAQLAAMAEAARASAPVLAARDPTAA